MIEKPYRILIVEDSPEDREFYRRRIAHGCEQDYRFWETASGEEGLRLYGEVMPHCVLLDYQLPDLNGLEFLDRLPPSPGAVAFPIVMLTGHGSEAVAVQAMKKGADDYLVKGLNNGLLRQVVHSVIDKGLLRRQLEEQRQELERLTAERLSFISELEQRTAALAAANQRKDDFLAMLAHELRNPLAPLRNMLQVMRLRWAQDAAVQQARAVMERQVVHLVRLVDDLLDVSRITRGRIELRKESVDLGAMVRHTIEINQPYLTERRHELNVTLPATALLIEADAIRLEQILSNLLNNAAKYTDPGGRIGVSVAREGEQAVVRIRDNGVGIAAELLPRVFDLFTQGTRSLDRAQGGLGIGLTLVKKLVELHGGTVQASSAGPGQGSEFVVRLRLAACPPQSGTSSAAGDPVPATRALRLLVVDDNIDAAESLATLLRLAGHRVRTVYDGLTALQAVQEELPEVLLLDIGLPGLDGFQVAERLRQQASLGQVLLIAVTGYCQPEDRQKSQMAGFHSHLVKPVDPVELQRLLSDAATSHFS